MCEIHEESEEMIDVPATPDSPLVWYLKKGGEDVKE